MYIKKDILNKRVMCCEIYTEALNTCHLQWVNAYGEMKDKENECDRIIL